MNERIGPPNPSTTLSRLARGVFERLGFWGSVVLPAAYLPVLYGTDGEQRILTVVALVVLNVACLLAGRSYGA
jgi:hypothetical protein